MRNPIFAERVMHPDLEPFGTALRLLQPAGNLVFSGCRSLLNESEQMVSERKSNSRGDLGLRAIFRRGFFASKA
jgi:hypothetical protein